MKLNRDAKKCLQRLYNHLGAAIEAAADLEQVFIEQKDKRAKMAHFMVELIFRAQTKINPMAEDNDIRIV